MDGGLFKASLEDLQQKLILAYEQAGEKSGRNSRVAIELLQAYGAALAAEHFPELGTNRSATLPALAAALAAAPASLRDKNPETYDFLNRISRKFNQQRATPQPRRRRKENSPAADEQQGHFEELNALLNSHIPSRIEAIRERQMHSVPSDMAYQLLREAIAFNKFSKSETSPWPIAHLNDRTTTGSAQLIPLAAENSLLPAVEEEKWVSVMWEQKEELSDLENDVLDALSAIWLHNARVEGDDVVIDVDDLLKLRGLKPKPGGSGFRGGYSQEQRNEMLRAVSRVANLWLDVARRRHRKANRDEIIQSRAIVISDRMGQLRTDGYLDVDSFVYRPGRIFSRYLLGPGRQTALLSAHALHYNPRTQSYEKRLVRYLSWQWRVRGEKGTYTEPYTVQKLLDATGIRIHPRKPGEAYERLERVLDTLQEDGVISAWQFVNWDEAQMSKRKWVDLWLSTLVSIEPPDNVKEHYGTLVKAKRLDTAAALPAAQKSLSQVIGQKIKAQRSVLGLSQFIAAEQIGISQPTLSKLENGYQVNLSKEMRKKIDAWLELNAAKAGAH